MESAREAFLRASNYYRTAEFFLHGNPRDPRILETWRQSRETFRRAARLFDHPIEVVKIPYGDTTLPGYVCRPDNSRTPRKTLILQTGFDGTAEELYLEVAIFALRRGYNVLIFEGPGQGGALREQHLYFRPDWEKVVTPVVDFALTRPEFDPRRLALMGISMGGDLAPRAAAFDPRLVALVANTGVYDLAEGKIPGKTSAERKQALKAMAKELPQVNLELRRKMKADPGSAGPWTTACLLLARNRRRSLSWPWLTIISGTRPRSSNAPPWWWTTMTISSHQGRPGNYLKP